MKLLPILLILLCICSCDMSESKHVCKREKQPLQSKTSLQESNKNSFKDLTTECYFDQLSSQFNFRLFVNYITEDSAVLTVTTSNKHVDKIIDSIIINSEYIMLPPMNGDCKDVRSYSTGFNQNKEIVDNSPGDFIVADFNFDGLDDFAVAVNIGGNGGYIYAFYIQNKKGKFLIDTFLSDKMLRFPVLFDKKKRTLMTSVHANTYQNCETKFQLTNGKWKVISSKLVDQ